QPVYPIFFEDVGALEVHARTGLTVETVASSTATPEIIANQTALGFAGRSQQVYSFDYGSGTPTNVSLTTAAGALTLDNSAFVLQYLAPNTNRVSSTYDSSDYANLLVYPSTVNATAFSGDLVSNNYFYLFPNARGNLTLLAQSDVSLGQITMFESDP